MGGDWVWGLDFDLTGCCFWALWVSLAINVFVIGWLVIMILLVRLRDCWCWCVWICGCLCLDRRCYICLGLGLIVLF